MGQLEGLYELLYELSEEKQQKMKYYTKHDLNKLILDCNEGHNLVNYILKLQDLLEEK